jgi:hypothetical protein
VVVPEVETVQSSKLLRPKRHAANDTMPHCRPEQNLSLVAFVPVQFSSTRGGGSSSSSGGGGKLRHTRCLLCFSSARLALLLLPTTTTTATTSQWMRAARSAARPSSNMANDFGDVTTSRAEPSSRTIDRLPMRLNDAINLDGRTRRHRRRHRRRRRRRRRAVKQRPSAF